MRKTDWPGYREAASQAPFDRLRHLWNTGVAAVSGKRAVEKALDRDGSFPADRIVSVGKAACSMLLGAQSCISPETRCLVVSKYGHIDAGCRRLPATEILEAGHPVPDDKSLVAGAKVLDMVAEAGAEDRLLLLVSGGASALAEVLPPMHDLARLQAVTRELLGSGKSIAEINEVRGRMSLIKGGRLLGRFSGREARVYALSDVQGDALSVIGAGLGDPARSSANVTARVIASNTIARNAVLEEAARCGMVVRVNEETLYDDVLRLAPEIAARLTGGRPGLYVWGGEPTIRLPTRPGTGGRNQSLALAIADRLRGTAGISVLVAGTDGTDGPTEYAGAFVDGETIDDPFLAGKALRAADAGTFLARRGCLFRSGPTSTNVMDLLIATVD